MVWNVIHSVFFLNISLWTISNQTEQQTDFPLNSIRATLLAWPRLEEVTTYSYLYNVLTYQGICALDITP